jgi:uncharacterized membrane protein YcaP (DUF421 family)
VDLFQLGIPAWQLVVRCIVIDIVLLTALRVFGKREIGQFTLYDLVLILLVANAVQPAMTGPDSSLLGGIIIIGGLVTFNFVLSQLNRFSFVHRLLFAEPRVIIRDGAYLQEALDLEGLDRPEIEEAIREHGVENVSMVKLGVLESDGNISIIPRDRASHHPQRRRVRFVRRG